MDGLHRIMRRDRESCLVSCTVVTVWESYGCCEIMVACLGQCTE